MWVYGLRQGVGGWLAVRGRLYNSVYMGSKRGRVGRALSAVMWARAVGKSVIYVLRVYIICICETPLIRGT